MRASDGGEGLVRFQGPFGHQEGYPPPWKYLWRCADIADSFQTCCRFEVVSFMPACVKALKGLVRPLRALYGP